MAGSFLSRALAQGAQLIEFEYESTVEPTTGKRQRRFRHAIPAWAAALCLAIALPGSFAIASAIDGGPPTDGPSTTRPDDRGDENGRGGGQGTEQGGPDGQGTGRGNGTTTTTESETPSTSSAPNTTLGSGTTTSTSAGGTSTTTPGGGTTSTIPGGTSTSIPFPPTIPTTTIPCTCDSTS